LGPLIVGAISIYSGNQSPSSNSCDKGMGKGRRKGEGKVREIRKENEGD